MGKLMLLLFFPVALILPVMADDSSPQLEASQVGRYQLINRKYEFNNVLGESVAKGGLFLLDTATGELSLCESKLWDGKVEDTPELIIQVTGCHSFEKTIRFPK